MRFVVAVVEFSFALASLTMLPFECEAQNCSDSPTLVTKRRGTPAEIENVQMSNQDDLLGGQSKGNNIIDNVKYCSNQFVPLAPLSAAFVVRTGSQSVLDLRSAKAKLRVWQNTVLHVDSQLRLITLDCGEINLTVVKGGKPYQIKTQKHRWLASSGTVGVKQDDYTDQLLLLDATNLERRVRLLEGP